MFAGAFDFNNDGASPFFVSTDGVATWSIFGTLEQDDKSIAWKADGSAVLGRRRTTVFDIVHKQLVSRPGTWS